MKTVIEMAREAGFMGHEDSFYTNHRYGDCKLELEHFAELVRADERKATLDEIAKWLEVEKDAPYWAELVRARSNT